MRGNEDDVGIGFADVAQELDAGSAGHLDVHEDEIGLVLADLAARLGRGGGFTDDLHVLVSDECTHPVAAVVRHGARPFRSLAFCNMRWGCPEFVPQALRTAANVLQPRSFDAFGRRFPARSEPGEH